MDISEDEAVIPEGDTRQLFVEVTPPDNSNGPFKWFTDDENVAVVDNNGLVTATGVGECNIGVMTTDGFEVSDTCHIIVDHVWDGETVVIQPTCTEQGYMVYTCSRCGESHIDESSYVNAAGHSFEEWETEYRTDRQPTCTSEGSKSIHCRNCEVTKDSTVIPATGQDDQPTVTENNNTAKVKLKSVKAAGKKKLKISWKKSFGQNGYQIQCAINRKFTKNKKTVNSPANAVNKTIKGLKSKKTYYVRIRSCKIVSGKKYYGAWSNVKKCKVK